VRRHQFIPIAFGIYLNDLFSPAAGAPTASSPSFSLESRNYPASKELASVRGLSRTTFSCVARLPSSVNFGSAFPSRSSSGLERRISFHESDTFRFVLTRALDRAMILYPPSCTSRPHCREKLPRMGTNSLYRFSHLQPQNMLILVILSCQRRSYTSQNPSCVQDRTSRVLLRLYFPLCLPRARSICLCCLLFCERVPYTPRFLSSANLSFLGHFLSLLVDSRRRQQ
jgi:hypothetical protein